MTERRPSRRRGAERALRESEERFRHIVEQARDYAILSTATDGTIVSWSPGAEAIFGWSAAEAIGQPIAITFTPEDRAKGEPERERETALREGVAPDVRWHMRKGGTRVFIEGSSRAMHDERGAPLGIFKIGQDITQRRETERALQASEARFRAVANLVPDLLWQSGRGGEAAWYNDRWYAYTGQTPDESTGFGWVKALHPDDRDGARDAYILAVRAGTPLLLEYRVRAADGSYRWFLARAEPIRDDTNEIVAWFGTATDINEQHVALDKVESRVGERTRQLAAANEALERAARQRNALRRQLTSAEEDERRRLARELHDQLGQHLAAFTLGLAEARRLIDDGLPAMRRLEQLEVLAQLMTRDARYLALELRPPELDDLGFESALQTYVEQWSARYGIMAELAITGAAADRPLPPDIGTALYRIAQESLTNVAKHSHAKQVSIIVDKPENSVRLVIEDDGRGFDQDEMARRVRRERRLGLAGMRERAALVGGMLEVESTPGHGTTLYVDVPLAERSREEGI